MAHVNRPGSGPVPARPTFRSRSWRAGNAIVGVLARAGIGPIHLLVTRGGGSGRQRVVPVVPVDLDGRRWLVAPYGAVSWVHDARAAGRVTPALRTLLSPVRDPGGDRTGGGTGAQALRRGGRQDPGAVRRAPGLSVTDSSGRRPVTRCSSLDRGARPDRLTSNRSRPRRTRIGGSRALSRPRRSGRAGPGGPPRRPPPPGPPRAGGAKPFALAAMRERASSPAGVRRISGERRWWGLGSATMRPPRAGRRRRARPPGG